MEWCAPASAEMYSICRHVTTHLTPQYGQAVYTWNERKHSVSLAHRDLDSDGHESLKARSSLWKKCQPLPQALRKQKQYVKSLGQGSSWEGQTDELYF